MSGEKLLRDAPRPALFVTHCARSSTCWRPPRRRDTHRGAHRDAAMLEEQVPEQFKQDAGNGARRTQVSHALFSRPMPGGGSVRVEILVSDRGNVAGERLRGRVVMDRSPQSGITGGALIVEELEGNDPDDVVPELLRIARDNAAIARRLLRHRSSVRAD